MLQRREFLQAVSAAAALAGFYASAEGLAAVPGADLGLVERLLCPEAPP
ncbi:MAG: hypothetical protein ACE5HL_08015 [Terriglobia bacterium]